MMHMTRGWTGFRTAVIALSLLALSTPIASADGILDYHTSGGPGTADISGSPAISFVPVQNGSVDTASNISLGTFVVAALPTGESTTYNNTPFSLSLIPDAYNGTSLTSADNTPTVITGYLNGTVTGANQSSVEVTFNPLTTSAFSLGSAGAGTLDLSNSKELLVPSSVNGGQTTLQAQVNATATAIGSEGTVPEPSTIALFLSTVCGLGLRRFVQNRRQRAAA
jgi:hypothetical protein